MKKTLNQIIAIFLAAACLCSLGISVFADGADGTGSVVTADGTAINGAGESAQETDSIIDANELKSRIDSYITAQGISGKNKVISIGYCYTATGDTWYYDGDQWCYSASLYKVPCCMLLAEKEYNGEITADTQINSQYASGTVDTMERKSIVNSDNYTGHAIVEYLGGTYNGKCADQTIKFTDLPADYFPSDFNDYSYYSAKYYTQVLMNLYFNSEKYPRIMDYMLQDQNYHYLDKNLNGQYQVAQKYGAFEEKNGNKNYHSAGIIYTPNPIIVTVMTKNITGFEKHIGALAEIIVNYTLELDSQLSTFQANKLIAQQQEAARAAQEEQARLEQQAVETAQAALTTQTAQTTQNSQTEQTTQNTLTTQTTQSDGASIFLDPTPVPSTDNAGTESGIVGKLLSLPVLIGVAVLLIVFIIVFAVKLHNSKLEEEMEYEDELKDGEYRQYGEASLEDLAPRQEKKKSSLKERFAKNGEYQSDDDFEDEYEARYARRKNTGSQAARNRYEDEYADEYEDQHKDQYSEQYSEQYEEEETEDKYPSEYQKKYQGKYQDEYEDGEDRDDREDRYVDSARDRGRLSDRKEIRYEKQDEPYESEELYKDNRIEEDKNIEAEDDDDIGTAEASGKRAGRFFGKGLFGRNRKARAVEYDEDDQFEQTEREEIGETEETEETDRRVVKERKTIVNNNISADDAEYDLYDEPAALTESSASENDDFYSFARETDEPARNRSERYSNSDRGSRGYIPKH